MEKRINHPKRKGQGHYHLHSTLSSPEYRALGKPQHCQCPQHPRSLRPRMDSSLTMPRVPMEPQLRTPHKLAPLASSPLIEGPSFQGQVQTLGQCKCRTHLAHSLLS